MIFKQIYLNLFYWSPKFKSWERSEVKNLFNLYSPLPLKYTHTGYWADRYWYKYYIHVIFLRLILYQTFVPSRNYMSLNFKKKEELIASQQCNCHNNGQTLNRFVSHQELSMKWPASAQLPLKLLSYSGNVLPNHVPFLMVYQYCIWKF